MRRRSSKGQSLVETTFILAAFFGLLLGMTGVGEMLFVRQTLVARAHDAARWGAVNSYDAEAIRNVVLYGTAAPERDATPFLGLTRSSVVVSNPGCPGADCRVTVAIPAHGILSMEPAEAGF